MKVKLFFVIWSSADIYSTRESTGFILRCIFLKKSYRFMSSLLSSPLSAIVKPRMFLSPSPAISRVRKIYVSTNTYIPLQMNISNILVGSERSLGKSRSPFFIPFLPKKLGGFLCSFALSSIKTSFHFLSSLFRTSC